MKIVAFAGQLCSGKDVASDFICESLNNNKNSGHWSRSAFAAAVKQVYMNYFDVDKNFIEEWKRKDEIPQGMLMNVRKGLQFIGDGFRKIKPSIWIDVALANENKQIVLSDARYINEAKAIRAKGGINVILYREGYLNDDPNPSESEIKPLVQYCIQNFKDGPVASISDSPYGLEFYDFFLKNDGSISDLYRKIDNLLVPYIESKYKGK